jgi:transglutaminase-like putative cysteine protease
MQVRVGCEFQYESQSPAPALVLVDVHPYPAIPNTILEETWETTPGIVSHSYTDAWSNRVRRLVLPVGECTLHYEALVEMSGEPSPVKPDAIQHPIEDLPDYVLVYTLASRYCLTETLSQTAWRLFGQVEPGWPRVQAICDWVHANIRYGGMLSTPTTTAVDVYVGGGGICRDFAHLAITFCRCLNIPARYVFGYLPEFRPPEEHTPMDFHAWFEAYLDGQWWTFDARFNQRLSGWIPVGIGRDAVDVAMVTSWGSTIFRNMVVWTDEVGHNGTSHEDRVGRTPVAPEGLVIETGFSPGEPAS